MKIVSRLVLLFLVTLTTTVSCKKSTAPPDKTQTIVLPANGPSIIAANNEVAFNFLRATLQQDALEDNKLISPLSIYMALSMLYNGAGNATKDSIAATLGIQGIDINTLNTVCQALITQLPGEDSRVQFSIANSIWYKQNSYTPLAPFLDITQTDYDATVRSLNFEDPNAVNTINNWVAQKTNNKIPTILKNIGSGDLMYLINAIYFNGAWKYAFKTSDTYTDSFHLRNGSTTMVPFMKQEVVVRSYTDSSFKMIELPYGGGKTYSMYIALPKDPQQPIGSFASLMDQTRLAAAIGKMDSANLKVEIPKWEYSYAVDSMQPELTQLGMGIAFTNGADFSKLYDPSQVKVKISKAIHKTYIKVNEEGTQAAAATAVGIIIGASNPAIFVFRVDHPFLYCIVEKQTGAVIFVGIVNDPSLN
jgi:serine protease inhibitor